VTIILRMDSGFFDQDNLNAFDKLGILFICTGKIYEKTKEDVGSQNKENWKRYDNGKQEWSFVEFGYRYDSWQRYYRAIYTKPVYEGQQGVLDFARPDNIILTNIGINTQAMSNCDKETQKQLMKAQAIIKSHHMRGADELPHRGIKDFGFEELPFKRFPANSALYYCMVITFLLFECFKEDVLKEVIPVTSYATTVRRLAVDFAAKIVKTGGEIILKVTKAIMESLCFDKLWERCQNPIPIHS